MIVKTENEGHVWGPEGDSGGLEKAGQRRRTGQLPCVPSHMAPTFHPHVPVGSFIWCLHQMTSSRHDHGHDSFSQERTMDLQPPP